MDNGEIDFYKSQKEPLELEPPVEVPLEALSAETLDSLVESFILREGTDYGSVEASLETKKAQILKQLKKGDIKITFDPASETVSLMTLRSWKQSQ